MKRFLIFPCILSLIIGLLAGILLPIDLSGKEPSPVLNNNLVPPSNGSQPADSGTGGATSAAPLDAEEKYPLQGAASAVNRCLQQQDWTTLSAYVHPERGVTFTPYSTVSPPATGTLPPTRLKIWPRTRRSTPGALRTAGATPSK